MQGLRQRGRPHRADRLRHLWPADQLGRSARSTTCTASSSAGHPNLTRLLMPERVQRLPAAEGLPPARTRRAGQLPRDPPRRGGGGAVSASDIQASDQLSGAPDRRAHDFGDRAISVEPGLHEKEMVLNFGPQHPACHGTLRLLMTLDGERVQDRSSPRSASSTPASRSWASSRTWNQFIVVTDRMNYMSGDVEQRRLRLRGRGAVRDRGPAPGRHDPRADGRAVAHQRTTSSASASRAWTWAPSPPCSGRSSSARSSTTSSSSASGGRLTTSYTRIGGLAFDLPDEVPGRVRKLPRAPRPAPGGRRGAPAQPQPHLHRADPGRGHHDHTRGGLIAYADHGPGRPRLAASTATCAATAPTWATRPTTSRSRSVTEGDVYARYKVRLDEVREAAKIVRQVLDRLHLTKEGRDQLPGHQVDASPPRRTSTPRWSP